VQNGSFAREWLDENRAGRPTFERLRQQDREHLIEQVGKQLRAMMPWAEEGKRSAGQSAAPKEPSMRRPAAPASATR
jgi:ketol-acid reductoisomerase